MTKVASLAHSPPFRFHSVAHMRLAHMRLEGHASRTTISILYTAIRIAVNYSERRWLKLQHH